MKKLITVIIAIGIYAGLSMLSGCSKTRDTVVRIPFQGPQNPSFEVDGYESYYYWNTSSYVYVDVGAYWRTSTGFLPVAIYQRLSGTSFMPSQGNWYASLTNYSNNGAASANQTQVYFYQDSVDLSHSTTLSFDYTFSCGSPLMGYVQPGSYPPTLGTVTAQLLFTSNGTITLWQQTISSTSTWTAGQWSTTTSPASPIQTLAQTITLPVLTQPGRLTFQIVSTPSTGFGPPTAVFNVDNVKVH